MIVLYATDVSLYSAKVAIALEHKGVPYERRMPPGGSYRAPEYRAIVPAGTLPAIDDGESRHRSRAEEGDARRRPVEVGAHDPDRADGNHGHGYA